MERRWTDEEIGDMREDLRELRGVVTSLEALATRLSAQDIVLSQIHAQTMKTNGRVTRLELDHAIREDREHRAADAITKRDRDTAASLTVEDRRNQRKFTIAGIAAGLMSSIIGYLFLIAIGAHP